MPRGFIDNIKPSPYYRFMDNSLITGLPGTGRTTYFVEQILHSIEENRPTVIFDPYGDIANKILGFLSEENLKNTAYIEIGNKDFPMGLNVFEKGQENKREVCNIVINLLYELFDPNRTGIIGPRFEHAVRNAILTILYDEQPTFLELVKCLTNQEYVNKLLPKVTDPIVARYWSDQIAKTSDFHKSEVLDYIVSKFGKFVTDPKLRNIVGQPKSTIDWAALLSEKKIILFDFSNLTDDAEAFYILSTLLLFTFIYCVRNNPVKSLCLFVDEATFWPSLALKQLLTDGKRYDVSLQTTTQRMTEVQPILQKELLRIESLTSFRLATEDARHIAPEFHSDITIHELCMLPKFHAYKKEVINGNPQKAKYLNLMKSFDVQADRSQEEIVRLKDELKKQYCRSVSKVEEEINKRIKES